MGVVYTAEDMRLERTVALKFLPPKMSADAGAKSRFLQEARAASALDHPNICTIHSVEETDDGQIFIVMAYYEGETLKDRIERDPLPLALALDVAIQVARGLARAHERGIVHRDIKPANLIRTDDGVTKILDFGLAKLAAVVESPPEGAGELPEDEIVEHDATRTDSWVGTLGYMSPEQVLRENVDRRTDLWALGVTLYQMVAGRRPFVGYTVGALSRAIVSEEPEALGALRSDCPAELDLVVRRALAKHPSDRYQSAEELIADLKRIGTDLKRSSERAGGTSSIAVLPFTNLGGDPEQEYFCDGMAEELIAALGRFPDLRVVARSSAFSFKTTELHPREVGRRLDVRVVLAGSVRRSGDRLCIEAQLIEVEDGCNLWSETYEREIEDIFAVQNEIVRAIVGCQAIRSIGRAAPLVRRPTEDLEAYNLHLRGRFHWSKRNVDELWRGIECFEQAIERDPGFAMAYSGLADCHNILGYYSTVPPGTAFSKAKERARKALEIDATLAEAHTSLAFATLFHDWDFTAADRSFQRAMALNPQYPTARQWYAEYLAFVGRPRDAVAVVATVLELDPLSLLINTLLGWVHYYAGDFERARTKLEEVHELQADFVPSMLWLGLACHHVGDDERAIRVLERAIDLSDGSPLMWSALGQVYAAVDKSADAGAVLDLLHEQARTEWVPPSQIAGIHAALGQHDEAFRWLERGFEQRDHWMVFLKVDPTWDRMRGDERFGDLTRRVGLPS
jgi:serine/threonine-protein kinase